MLSRGTWQAHYMLGLALLQRKDYSEGVKELEKVWIIHKVFICVSASFMHWIFIQWYSNEIVVTCNPSLTHWIVNF